MLLLSMIMPLNITASNMNNYNNATPSRGASASKSAGYNALIELAQLYTTGFQDGIRDGFPTGCLDKDHGNEKYEYLTFDIEKFTAKENGYDKGYVTGYDVGYEEGSDIRPTLCH